MERAVAAVIPYLFYRDVPAALGWLSRCFGFIEEMRHATPGGMHAQMLFEGQRIMMGQVAEGYHRQPPGAGVATMAVFIYLDDVDALHRHAVAAGAVVETAPHEVGYGRTMTICDLEGHPWYFTTPPGASA